MENIVKLLVPAFAALTLSAASVSAFALTTGDLYGEPAAANAVPSRTIVVTPQTKFINVAHGEVVNLKIGSQEMSWNFDGLARPFDLAKIAPEGSLDHKVQVYVESEQQRDGGFGD
jgi:heavy-metal resistance protein CzcE